MPAARRPNIVYIHSHDTGRYVSPYGYEAPTPHLQRLAEGGVVFRDAYSVAPTCSPSRAALTTGRYPHEVGMLGLANRGFSLHDYGLHLAPVLGTAGYTTALAGVQHVTTDWAEIGYTEVLPIASRDAPDVSAAAVEFLARRAGSDDGPFFLDVGFRETHRHFDEADERDDPRWQRPPDPLPDIPEVRDEMAQFRASLRRLDDGIGTVLEALDEHGLAEDTLVVCTTDHGLPFPSMKGQLTTHGLGVMLLVRGPGFTGGRVVDAMVSQLDVYPTICVAAGLPAPDGLRGCALQPLAAGEVDRLHDAVYGETTFHVAYTPQRALRTERWVYVRRFEERGSRPILNEAESPTLDAMVAHGWSDLPRERELLYDRFLDPNESANLASDERVRTVLEDLRGRLDAWMADTDDPLCHGPVAPPPGARVDDPGPNPVARQANVVPRG
ncbi:sulfatase family protein [Isoptericola aurantiacus]|uniref:sulfatase family protein n=1 Tax=Isoptericola aurantiacus TaxID=3377839 RepID=UPI00383A5EBF